MGRRGPPVMVPEDRQIGGREAVGSLNADAFIARKSAQYACDLARGRVLRMKDITRRGFHLWRREAWTFMVQHDIATKVFQVDRLRFVSREGDSIPGHREGQDAEPVYRFGYWVVARNGSADGRWWWAQFSPMIPSADFEDLIGKARTEGTILGPVSPTNVTSRGGGANLRFRSHSAGRAALPAAAVLSAAGSARRDPRPGRACCPRSL
ncbi:MAG: hypothetical protein HY263_06505 [Chloroflexi bacterium]|nr:hypothetical protein [Chloroflexota bacterium]